MPLFVVIEAKDENEGDIVGREEKQSKKNREGESVEGGSYMYLKFKKNNES